MTQSTKSSTEWITMSTVTKSNLNEPLAEHKYEVPTYYTTTSTLDSRPICMHAL